MYRFESESPNLEILPQITSTITHLVLLAEGVGFEPTNPFRGQTAFKAAPFTHVVALPSLLVIKRVWDECDWLKMPRVLTCTI